MKPAFFASETESGFSFTGELNVEMILRTGFLQSGHFVNSGKMFVADSQLAVHSWLAKKVPYEIYLSE